MATPPKDKVKAQADHLKAIEFIGKRVNPQVPLRQESGVRSNHVCCWGAAGGPPPYGVGLQSKLGCSLLGTCWSAAGPTAGTQVAGIELRSRR